MADLSIRLADPSLRSRLERAADPEGKILRALDALGPVAGRDVVLVEAEGVARARQLRALGARVRHAAGSTLGRLAPGGAEVLVACWSGFEPSASSWESDLARACRVLRPGGRLLVVQDYGRDDVSRLLGDADRERRLIDWSRPSGPYLEQGFRIRVLHCWWSWPTLEEAREALTALFGAGGAAYADGMRRPRLAWKVAVYHRTVGEDGVNGADPTAARAAGAAGAEAADATGRSGTLDGAASDGAGS